MVSEEDVSRLIQEYERNFIKLIEYSIQNIEESTNQVLSLDLQQIQATSNSVKILARVIPFSYKCIDTKLVWWQENRMPKLIKNALDLLHTPVYSVTASLSNKKTDGVVLALLWKEGLLLKNQTVEVGEVIWLRRYELLLLVKAILTDIYPSLSSGQSGGLGLSSDFLVTQNIALQTVYSILNTLITFNPNGIWNLPYSSYVSSSKKEKCLKVGLQILCILNYSTPVQASRCRDNTVKALLSGLKNREDLILIWNGVKGLYNSILTASNTYLPGSQKTFKLDEELLMFLLTMIKENESFIHVIISSEACVKILLWIFNFLLATQNMQAATLSSYVLIKLSEQRKFSVLLNTILAPCPLDLPLFTGSYGDMCILAVSKLINNKQVNQSTVLLLLTFLSNISPYLKDLCPQSAHSLIKIFQELSINLTDPPSQEALGIQLEILANFIQYQWRGSIFLVYWLLQNSSLVYKIDKLSIDRLKPFISVCLEAVKNLKELKHLQISEFYQECKITTLVGLLPQPHQIVTRKINFEDSKMLRFAFQLFFVDERGNFLYE